MMKVEIKITEVKRLSKKAQDNLLQVSPSAMWIIPQNYGRVQVVIKNEDLETVYVKQVFVKKKGKEKLKGGANA